MGKESSTDTQVARVGLKRVALFEWVQADPLLRTAPLMRAISAQTQKALLDAARVRRLPVQAPLFRQGDSGNSLFWILKGEVRLFSNQAKETVEVGVARRGEVVGEDSVLDASGRLGCSAMVSEELDVAELPCASVQKAWAECEALAQHLRELQKARQAIRDELAAFMNRW